MQFANAAAMKLTVTSIAVLLLSSACGEGRETKAADVENTSRNTRDRDGGTLTPTDQTEDQADLKVTSAIRKALMDIDDLSTNAENIKIITVGGVVTLRGPVESLAEKAKIEAAARSVAGVQSVTNELEVKR
jgi:hyperosmotically inducible periplasmic protein